MWWCEVRPWQRREGKPFFVPLSDLQGKLGFRSVYAYPEDVRDLILARGSAADLHDRVVFSDKLFLDFDNVGCADTIELLADMGVAFSVWTSGNRSFHIHVDLVPMVGAYVPYSQKRWVAANIPDTADLTFYTHTGQFRLPGTIHEKTGQRKVRQTTYPGTPLEMPIVEPPQRYTGASGSAAPGYFNARILRAKSEPGRRVFAWHLAKTAKEEGVPYDEALQKILWWNDSRCSPPLPPEAVRERVLQVYTKRSR